MINRAKDMVRAALAADTLALGVHWIYDPARVAALFEPRRMPLAPQPDSYHKTKALGDFTHYGDQTMVLLESMAAMKKFDLDDWAKRWRRLFENYSGYIDHATKDTLDNFSKGLAPDEAGSMSADMSPAARMAPIFLAGDLGEDELVGHVRGQASLTTRNKSVLSMVAFWAAAAWHILSGRETARAMELAEKRLAGDPTMKLLYKAGLESFGEPSVEAITRFGASCDAFKMFPGVIHLLGKYENQPAEGLAQSILAGGDNAVRTSLLATLLAARHGVGFMPPAWYEAVNQRPRIEELLTPYPGGNTV